MKQYHWKPNMAKKKKCVHRWHEQDAWFDGMIDKNLKNDMEGEAFKWIWKFFVSWCDRGAEKDGRKPCTGDFCPMRERTDDWLQI